MPYLGKILAGNQVGGDFGIQPDAAIVILSEETRAFLVYVFT